MTNKQPNTKDLKLESFRDDSGGGGLRFGTDPGQLLAVGIIGRDESELTHLARCWNLHPVLAEALQGAEELNKLHHEYQHLCRLSTEAADRGDFDKADKCGIAARLEREKIDAKYIAIRSALEQAKGE